MSVTALGLRMTALLALGLLAACAPPGAGDKPFVQGQGVTTPARAAVVAFGQICGRLDREEVARQAARFGFGQVRREALPPEAQAMMARENTTIFLRPVPGSPMVFWNESPHCELIAGGLPLAEMEAEFDLLLAALGNSAELSVARATPAQLAALPVTGPARPRQAAIVMSRALTAGSQRSFMLSVSQDPARGPVVSLSTRGFMPGAPAPVQGRGEAKD